MCQARLRGSPPKPAGYPAELRHLGDHLHRRRFEIDLSMAALGRELGVDDETIANWEAGSPPRADRHLDRLHEFLGYCPLDYRVRRLGTQVRAWRRAKGLGQESAASALGVSYSTLKRLEGGRLPSPAVRSRVSMALEERSAGRPDARR